MQAQHGYLLRHFDSLVIGVGDDGVVEQFLSAELLRNSAVASGTCPRTAAATSAGSSTRYAGWPAVTFGPEMISALLAPYRQQDAARS